MELINSMNAGVTIQINNQTLDMHPSGALFWLDAAALIVADLHLIPQSTLWKLSQKEHLAHFAQSQLKHLQRVMEQYMPDKVIILGDVTGVEHKPIQTVFHQWISKRPEEFILVKNFSVNSLALYEKLNITHFNSYEKKPFYLSHNPSMQLEHFTICGQVQPGVMVEGIKESKNLMPCFYLNERQLILPSFGGNFAKIEMQPNEEVMMYPIGFDQIHHLSLLLPLPA